MAGKTSKKPTLLSGGNPQIAKADGDAPVQAYIAAMPGWKSDVGRRLDTLIVRTVPGVRKAFKWPSPFYGIEGRGWKANPQKPDLLGQLNTTAVGSAQNIQLVAKSNDLQLQAGTPLEEGTNGEKERTKQGFHGAKKTIRAPR